KHLHEESLDFRVLTPSDEDSIVVKGVKFLMSQLFSSVRLTIVHSRVLRRFLSLEGCPGEDTLKQFQGMIGNDETVLSVIETGNGVMISGIDTARLGEHLDTLTAHWVAKRERFIANDPAVGFYKKLFRLKFVYDHLTAVYTDRYNVYQAAYVDSAYTVRAVLCFVMQVISSLALIDDGGISLRTSRHGGVDAVLVVVTVMYMYFNLPANSITSSMSHNCVLFNIFAKMKMYRRLIFVAMDLVVNSFLISLMPLISARLLNETTGSASIVTTFLSVFFVTSLDDTAVTKSESNNMRDSQSALLRDVTEKVDSFVDSRYMWVVAYLPWFESLLVFGSVVASYFVLFNA
ncbi:unnamed protein product, partial [Pylaiella littoralis]